MRGENQISADRQVAGLKPISKPFEVSVADARGLTIRVFPDGTRMFEFRYTALNGTRRRLQLGPYPGLGLADARQEAQKLRVAVVRGEDPAADRAAAKHAARTGETVAELAAAYFVAATKGLHGGRHLPKRQSTIKGEKRLWRDYIEPELGARRFTEIRRADIKTFMRTIATESGLAPASVATVGGVLSNILGFAVYEDKLESNPALGLTRPIGWSSRERRFSDEAIAALWNTLVIHSAPRQKDAPQEDEISRLAPQTCLALRFALTTLCRRTEAAGARWSEIDRRARVWSVPADRVKTARSLVVPLSSSALEILDAAATLPGAGDEWVFSRPADSEKHVDEHAMTRAIARL
jgi:integrase